MANFDNGLQNVLWRFETPINSDILNRHSHKIVAPGIYDGMEVTFNGGLANVSPGLVAIQDGAGASMTVTIRTDDVAVSDDPLTEASPVLVWRYTYAKAPNNYADLLVLSWGEVNTETDVVICEGNFDSGVLDPVPNYSNRTVGFNEKINSVLDSCRIVANPVGVNGLKVKMLPGTVNVRNTTHTFHASDGEEHALQSEAIATVPGTAGQYKKVLVYISMAGQLELAVPSAWSGSLSAAAPPSFTDRVPLAVITIQGGQTWIEQRHIQDVRPWLALNAQVDGWSDPVSTISELKNLPADRLVDRQLRLVKDLRAVFMYDTNSTQSPDDSLAPISEVRTVQPTPGGSAQATGRWLLCESVKTRSFCNSVADVAALQAVPASRRLDGDVRFVRNQQAWFYFNASSSVTATASGVPYVTVIQPSSGSGSTSGRWLRIGGASITGGDTFVGPVTNKGALTNVGDVAISSDTVSSSPTTGALKVTGGVGVGGDLNVAGSIKGYSIEDNSAFSSPSIMNFLRVKEIVLSKIGGEDFTSVEVFCFSTTALASGSVEYSICVGSVFSRIKGSLLFGNTNPNTGDLGTPALLATDRYSFRVAAIPGTGFRAHFYLKLNHSLISTGAEVFGFVFLGA